MNEDRPPSVAEEVARLPALGTPECVEALRAIGAELRAETLVHLLRASAVSVDTSLFEVCGRLLIGQEGANGRWSGGHCERIIMSLAKHYGFHTDRDVLLDFRSQCHTEMWKAIHAGHAEKPLWEEVFGFCLKRACIQVARSLARRRQRQQEHERPLLEWEEAEGTGHAEQVLLEDEVLGGIEEETVVAAIRRLPTRQAEAALLAWVERRPIESDAPDSVKSIMGITDRRVYQLLVKARARLLLDPVIRAKRDEA